MFLGVRGDGRAGEIVGRTRITREETDRNPRLLARRQFLETADADDEEDHIVEDHPDHPVLTRLLSEDEDIIRIIRSFLTRLLSEDEDIVHGNI